MRVMLDTNVLVSAIIFPNSRMDSLIHKATLGHQLVLSSYVIEELLEVTERKFPDKIKSVNLFLLRLPYQQFKVTNFGGKTSEFCRFCHENQPVFVVFYRA